MGAHPWDLIPVVQRSYDLCAALYEHVNRFPRAQRTLLGRVILEDALQMPVLLTMANREGVKSRRLGEASGRLDALRITLRMSMRLSVLSHKGYEALSQDLDEIGRMLGGWLKQRAAASAETIEVRPVIPAAPAKRPRGGIRSGPGFFLLSSMRTH